MKTENKESLFSFLKEDLLNKKNEVSNVSESVDNRFYDEAKKKYPKDRISLAIFEEGAKHGADWQKEQDTQTIKALLAKIELIDSVLSNWNLVRDDKPYTNILDITQAGLKIGKEHFKK